MTAASSARCACPAKSRPASPARDAWAAADDMVLRKIAQAGLSGLTGMINGTPGRAAAAGPRPGKRGPAVAQPWNRPTGALAYNAH